MNLKGVVPAAVLPMDENYEPDYDAYSRYLEWLIGQNAVALAINMDTGEGPQLTREELRRVAETAVAVARGKCAVVAGVLGATTQGSVEIASMYAETGVDGLVVFPHSAFRNTPLDPRIPYEYHKAIAEETGLPIVLFQLAPVFGGVNYARETLLRLLDIPEVVAIKEASFDVQVFANTKETLGMADRPITLLTGNDRFITESFLLGAEGGLLGFAAIGCRLVAEMLECFARGEHERGVSMRPRVQGLADFIYHDPVLDYRARCKVALAHVGVIKLSQTYVRPPLLQVHHEYEAIGEALVEAGMLNQAAG